MTVTIDVRSNIKQVTKSLQRKITKLPKKVNIGAYDFAKIVKRNLRYQLTRNKTIWRRKLWNSIKAKKMSGNRSVVTMNQEGIFLDRAKPHYVKLKRGRLISKWAKQKGNKAVKGIAKREGSIFVKPHPFIQTALMKSRKHLSPTLKRRVKEAFA